MLSDQLQTGLIKERLSIPFILNLAHSRWCTMCTAISTAISGPVHIISYTASHAAMATDFSEKAAADGLFHVFT